MCACVLKGERENSSACFRIIYTVKSHWEWRELIPQNAKVQLTVLHTAIFFYKKPPRAKALPMSKSSDGLREGCPWRLRYTPKEQNQTVTWSVGPSILFCPHQDRLPFCFKYTQASHSFITVTGSHLIPANLRTTAENRDTCFYPPKKWSEQGIWIKNFRTPTKSPRSHISKNPRCLAVQLFVTPASILSPT